MNDFAANVAQAIADFDGIKTAVESCGVPVGNSPASQYNDKIELIGQSNDQLLFTSGGRPYIEKVVVPEGTTALGAYAYQGCNKLTEIVIPASVASIGSSSLAETGLEEIVVTNPDAALNDGCFMNCKKLMNVVLPANLQKLPQFALYGASSLQALDLPDSITKLEMSSINTCKELRTLHFSASLKTIALSNLRYCGLDEAVLPAGLEIIEGSVLRDCPNLKRIFLPASLTAIGEAFLAGDTNLEEVILGKGFNLNLNISMSSKYTVQILLDCLYNYADRSGQGTLVFTIGAANLAKLDGIYVLETESGLEMVESTAAGAVPAIDYAASKNITLA